MSYDMDDLNCELRHGNEKSKMPKHGKFRGLSVIGLVLVFGVGIVAGAIGWRATHTFLIPAVGQPITDMTFSDFTFQLNAPANTVVLADSFAPTSDTSPTVTYFLTGASGLTISIIALEIGISCTVIPPTLDIIPGTVNLIGGMTYNYCIYYSSGASIASGSLVISYSG